MDKIYKCEIYRDSFQNYKRYHIPRAQLVICDVPYGIGNNFYGSNPMWYQGGTIKTEKANLPEKLLLIRTLTLTFMSIFIFAQRCYERKIRKALYVAEVATAHI